MPELKFTYSAPSTHQMGDGLECAYNTLPRWEFESFNQYMLGLGDVALGESRYRQALVVFMDLEGFTSFCNQPRSNKTVPQFLTLYLDWLLAQLREGLKHSEEEMRVGLLGSLPFYVKFLGDGMLFIWDTEQNLGDGGIMNVIYTCARITRRYKSEFVKHLSGHFTQMPGALRCGVARGQIIALGNGNDYVGSCINIAARLQKLQHYTFAVHQEGVDLAKYPKHALSKAMVPLVVTLRGIGESEPVYVLKDEVKKEG